MNKEPLRIYVAGPYSPKNCSLHDAARVAQRNTNKAIVAGNALMAKGHYVFVPHLTHYLHIADNCLQNDPGFWYHLDNTFLDRWANAFFYLAPSYGADLELERAKLLGYRIFTKISDVPNYCVETHLKEKP